MIKLTIFPPAFGLRNVSPFCLKVEMALAHLKLEHEIAIEADPRKAPKGKLPYIVTDSDEVIADSEIVFDYLDKISHGGLYGHLTAVEIAQGKAMTRLVEDHLYWIMVASRWVDDDWFPNVREGFFGALPGPMTSIIGYFARKQVIQTYELHGLGKHSLEQQKEFATQDLRAINDLVSENGYIVGKSLSVFDFSVAALIAGIVDQKPRSWMNPLLEKFPAAIEYAERIQKEVGIYGRETV